MCKKIHETKFRFGFVSISDNVGKAEHRETSQTLKL